MLGCGENLAQYTPPRFWPSSRFLFYLLRQSLPAQNLTILIACFGQNRSLSQLHCKNSQLWNSNQTKTRFKNERKPRVFCTVLHQNAPLLRQNTPFLTCFLYHFWGIFYPFRNTHPQNKCHILQLPIHQFT